MEILFIIILILLNGLFSMSEIALVSARKFKLERAAKKGSTGAKKALDLSENPNNFLSTVQIGITLIGILTGILGGEKLSDDLEAHLLNIPLLAPYAHSLAVMGIVILITYFSLVFGELVPKRIGLIFPEAIAASVAHIMSFISNISKPFIWFLGKSNDLILKVFNIKDDNKSYVSEDEIKSIIEESTNSGEIQEIENTIVKRVFDLGDRKAGELMTHRSNLIWFELNDPIEKIKRIIEEEPHGVYPVADNNLDNIVGTVSLKTLFPKKLDPDNFILANHIKKPLYVLENSPVYQVLDRFKSSRVHIAFVVDEYGSMQGIITLEDVLNALVGDVTEAEEEPLIYKRDENSWLADGQLSYYDLLTYFKVEEREEAEGFNTLAGLILHHLRHIPVSGEKIQWKDFEFEVVDMDERRIDKVMIKKTERFF